VFTVTLLILTWGEHTILSRSSSVPVACITRKVFTVDEGDLRLTLVKQKNREIKKFMSAIDGISQSL
jgi:hypothetical protein